MRTYLLVHGGWVGGWAWREFAPLLRAKGHEVYTPTLTGLGERVHLYRPEVGLETHVQDIVNVIEYEALHDIVLLGHSYGGMVVTGVADRVSERIAHLVYLDAFLPRNGESMADFRDGDEYSLQRADDGRFIPFPPPDEEAAQRRARWVLQPAQTFYEKVRLSVPLEERAFTRTYIRAANFPEPILDGFKERVQGDPRWRCEEWPCGHAVYLEMPGELANLLLEFA